MRIIYCDGSSLGNPGKGGFGVVAIDTQRNKYWEFGKGYKMATNNQMELEAAIFGLDMLLESKLEKDEKVEFRLDSKYVIQGVTEWSKNWQKNNWKTAAKKDVLNKECWQRILSGVEKLRVNKVSISWVHVYGHNGEKWNERVDEIARLSAAGNDPNLQKAADLK